MGYNNRYSGAITITPPLTCKQIREAHHENLKDVRLRIVEQQIESDDGETVTVRTTADAIIPLDMEYSGHSLEDEIQSIVDAFSEHEFAGFIEARWDAGFGEPPSRLIVKDDRVMRIDAQYRWPGIWPDERAQDERDCDDHTTTVEYGPLDKSTRSLIAAVTSHVAANEVSADFADDNATERDGYAVRLLNMLEADPDRFRESEEEDLRAALSALFRCTAEAANLATVLAESQAERNGAAQAVAEAVSILEGMLNEDAWAYDAGRARNVLLDYFARDLDALEARDTKAGE